MLGRETPDARATALIPPRPIVRASAASKRRRWRSFNSGITKQSFSFSAVCSMPEHHTLRQVKCKCYLQTTA